MLCCCHTVLVTFKAKAGILLDFWENDSRRRDIFKSNVLSVLLYGAESWKVTKNVCQELESFQNKCIRSILRIYWPNKISNYELRRKTCVRPVPLEVKQRRWRWIGHICRMPLVAIPRMAGVGLQMEKERGEDPGRRGDDRLSVEREMKEK